MARDNPEPPMDQKPEPMATTAEDAALPTGPGQRAMEAVRRPTTGSHNTAVGPSALMLTTSAENTIVGYGSLAKFGLNIEQADGGLIINGKHHSWDAAERRVDSTLRDHGYSPGSPLGEAAIALVSFRGKWWHMP